MKLQRTSARQPAHGRALAWLVAVVRVRGADRLVSTRQSHRGIAGFTARRQGAEADVSAGFRLLAGVVLGMAVLAMAGCTSGPLARKTPASAAGPSVAAVPALRMGELTPHEQAQTCMATAQSLAASGHDAEATALYERAGALDPSLRSQVAHPLAVLYERQGDHTRALQAYRRALAAQPHNGDILNDLGCYYLQIGQPDAAEEQFRQALRHGTDSPRLRVNLGICLARQRRYQEAYAMFEPAVGPAAAHSNVGVIAARNGDLDTARHAFHQALAHDPTLRQPQMFLAHLNRRETTYATNVPR